MRASRLHANAGAALLPARDDRARNDPVTGNEAMRRRESMMAVKREMDTSRVDFGMVSIDGVPVYRYDIEVAGLADRWAPLIRTILDETVLPELSREYEADVRQFVEALRYPPPT